MIHLIYCSTRQDYFLINTDLNCATGWRSTDPIYPLPNDFDLIFINYPSFSLIDSLDSLNELKLKHPEYFI